MSDDWPNGGFSGAEHGVEHRYPARLASVLSAGAGRDDVHILDLGSAAGTIGIWLSGHDARFSVLGVDRHADLVADANQLAEAKNARARFVVADASEGLPARAGSLDGAVVHRLRDGLISRQQRVALMDELSRVLRPGGWLSLLEDMRVRPHERHGEWYRQRYLVSKTVVQLLADEARLDFARYADWLADEESALLLSLREPDGTKVDDVAYAGREEELAARIVSGGVRLRGVGIHQTAKRIKADLEARGLVIRQRWTVEIAEPPPRSGHATIMKGFLAQRDDRPAG